jgi:hypothetical protein
VKYHGETIVNQLKTVSASGLVKARAAECEAMLARERQAARASISRAEATFARAVGQALARWSGQEGTALARTDPDVLAVLEGPAACLEFLPARQAVLVGGECLLGLLRLSDRKLVLLSREFTVTSLNRTEEGAIFSCGRQRAFFHWHQRSHKISPLPSKPPLFLASCHSSLEGGLPLFADSQTGSISRLTCQGTAQPVHSVPSSRAPNSALVLQRHLVLCEGNVVTVTFLVTKRTVLILRDCEGLPLQAPTCLRQCGPVHFAFSDSKNNRILLVNISTHSCSALRI